MKNLLIASILIMFIISCQGPTQTIYLDEMDLSKMEIGWGENQINKSVDGNPLTIAGLVFERGVGTHAVSKMMIDLHGEGKIFSAMAGLDDESGERASVEFFVLGDGKVLWQSGLMKKGDTAKSVKVDLSGIQKMALYISDGGDYIHYDHVDWANAFIKYYGEKPMATEPVKQESYILTPPVPDAPRINYPRVYGAGTDRSFLFRIPASGKRPMNFTAKGIPPGLKLDQSTGIISGQTTGSGTYAVSVTAKNNIGEDTQTLKIYIGFKLALTPPMG